MGIFDNIRHRQRLQTVRQATRLAGKDPVKLRDTVKDYLETKPKERRLEVGAALLTATLERAPAPRQGEVARALLPGLCKSSKHYAAGLRVAKALDMTRLEALGFSLGKKLAVSGSGGSYRKFYEALDGALIKELSGYQFVRYVRREYLEQYADFLETPVGRKFWELTLSLMANFKPKMFEHELNAANAATPQERAAVAMLTASNAGQRTSFVEQIARPYTQNLTVEEMATCSKFFATSASKSVAEAMKHLGEYWDRANVGRAQKFSLEPRSDWHRQGVTLA